MILRISRLIFIFTRQATVKDLTEISFFRDFVFTFILSWLQYKSSFPHHNRISALSIFRQDLLTTNFYFFNLTNKWIIVCISIILIPLFKTSSLIELGRRLICVVINRILLLSNWSIVLFDFYAH